MQINPEELVAKSPQISSLPFIFYQVNEAVNDPESSFTDIANIVSGDAGLSARLLKIVNSSFYGFPSEIETITHAITIIGTAQLRDLVLATTVMNKFKGISLEALSMNDFWRHSIACGLAARIISTFRQEPNAERYYILGLLHDIGRLALFMTLQLQSKEIIQRARLEEKLMHDIEQEILGIDHAIMGKALLKVWNLSPRLGETIGNHHDLDPASDFLIESAIIHVADIIATAMQFGSSGEQFIPKLNENAWRLIGLPTSKLGDIMDQVDAQFHDVIGMFLGG